VQCRVILGKRYIEGAAIRRWSTA